MFVRRFSRIDRISLRIAAAPDGARQPRSPRRVGRLITLSAGAALVLASAAAPSASAAPGPTASYHTQSLPAGTMLAEAASASAKKVPTTRVTFKASKRFSLAALRWNDGRRPITGRLRAKKPAGGWTTWSTFESEQAGPDGVVEGADPAAVRAAQARSAKIGLEGSTEPIWTGPARTLQVELTGRRPAGLRVAFVDVKEPAIKKRAPIRAYAARARQTADASLAGIQPRAAWDPNNECAPRATPELGSVQGVVVHHTAGSNEYTQAQVPAVMLAICKYHRNSNGWNDVGYNVLVDKFGGAWEGRAGGLTNAVVGAHAQGFNSVTAGISMIGDYTAIAPSPETLATVARVAAWKLAVAGAPRTGTVTLTSAGGSLSRFGAGKVVTLPRIVGHRDVGLTACPGNTGYTTLDGIRAAAATINPLLPVGLSPGPAPAPIPVTITISTKTRVMAGTPSVISGSAKQGVATLKSAAVALQVGGGDNWITVASTRTDSAGKFSFKRKFSRTWGMRVARTDGDGGTSSAVNVVLVPKLTLTVPKRLVTKRAITLRGTLSPGRGPITLEVWRQSSNRKKWVKGQVQKVTVKGRRLTVRIKPNSAALYRFRVVFKGTELAATARSAFAYGRSTPAKGSAAAATQSDPAPTTSGNGDDATTKSDPAPTNTATTRGSAGGSSGGSSGGTSAS